jgi:hypothetical protein
VLNIDETLTHRHCEFGLGNATCRQLSGFGGLTGFRQ